MAKERTYTSHSVFDGDEVSYTEGNDMERLREIESEAVKTESGKLGLAGLMAMGAAAGLIATSTLSAIYSFEFWEVLHSLFLVIGMASAIYGTIKTIRTLRGKTLNMPSLEVLRKNISQAQPNVNIGGYNRNQAQTQTQNRNVNTQTSSSPTLRRSRKHRVFAGVAGGLAEYMGVSPILTRIAFLISIPATSFFSVFIYLLLALVLPKNYDEWRTRNK